MVRLPGIEPGFRAWKARVITPRQQAQVFTRGRLWLTIASRFKDVVAVSLSGQSVEGRVMLKQNALSWMVSGRVNLGG